MVARMGARDRNGTWQGRSRNHDVQCSNQRLQKWRPSDTGVELLTEIANGWVQRTSSQTLRRSVIAQRQPMVARGGDLGRDDAWPRGARNHCVQCSGVAARSTANGFGRWTSWLK